MEEQWNDVEGFEGLYKISNKGRVRSLHGKGRILKTAISRFGYERVVLSNINIRKTFSVHRLVAQAFIPNPDNKPQVNHKNIFNLSSEENKRCNIVDNLEWCTSKENINHALETKLKDTSKIDYSYARNMMAEYNKKNKSKPVVKINFNTLDVLERYSSLSEASIESGYATSSLYDCCIGKKRTIGGFVWRYEDNIDVKIPKNKCNKSVAKIDKNTGMILKTYITMTDAGNDVGKSRTSIRNYINEISNDVFLWKFIDLEEIKNESIPS